MIQREVTFTRVDFALIEVIEGQAEMKNHTVILAGNLDKEKATRLLTKEFGLGVTVLSIEANTKKFEMPVTTFIELAEEVQE